MVALAFPSKGGRHPHVSRNYAVASLPEGSSGVPVRPGSGIRILTTPEELSAAFERAEAYERQNAENLAERLDRHAAALTGTIQSPELKGLEGDTGDGGG